MEILNRIQKELKAPKGQKNTFGNYNYRSCEDILEAVKPLLGAATLVLTDEIVLIGDRYYVKATATINDGKIIVSSAAFARESLDKKGMDSAQITGAASSYARKYALNGLFCIDDTKDADGANNTAENGYIDQKQLGQLTDYINNLNINRKKFCEHLKIEALEKLQKVDFQKAMSVIEAIKKTNDAKQNAGVK